jgi:hypothetical protein
MYPASIVPPLAGGWLVDTDDAQRIGNRYQDEFVDIPHRVADALHRRLIADDLRFQRYQ